MQVTAEYVAQAFAKMLDAARRSGRHLNTPPLPEGTNSVGALVVHCCEVCEFWLGHVALGRPSARRREAEFRAHVALTDLEALVERTVARTRDDLDALAAGQGVESEVRQFLPAGGGDESLVLHVIEELYQHLGHMELTLDVLAGDGRLHEPLHHLALREDWERAEAAGSYEVSTIGRGLAEEGFIHCSFADQVAATAARFYAGRDDVVLLRIDPRRLEVPVRVEGPSGAEQFPHLYGPLPVGAVVEATPLAPGPDGVPELPEWFRVDHG